MKSCNYPVWADVPNGNYDVSIVGCDGSQETIFRGHAYDPSGTAQVDLANIAKYEFNTDGIRIPDLESGEIQIGLPQMSNTLAGTYFKGKYYLVGNSGNIATSTDLSLWETRAPLSTTGAIYDIETDGNILVVVKTRYIYYSYDGEEFIEIDTRLGVSLNSVLYANDKWIVVGAGNTILTSPDGIAWTQVDYSPTQTQELTDVAYGNGLYVAIAGNTLYSTVSSDGVNWSTYQLNTPALQTLRSITYGNGTFVICGNNGLIATTINGQSSTTEVRDSGVSSTLYEVSYGNNMFIAVGASGQKTYSTDSSTWTPIAPIGISNLQLVFYANNTWITSGAFGTLETSIDGIDWSGRTNSIFRDIAYGNGLYVAVGNSGTIIYSTNAVDWSTVIGLPTNSLYSVNYIEEVNLWITVGSVGAIHISLDGINWNSVSVDVSSALYDTVYFNGYIYLCGALGVLFRSSDGETWTRITLTDTVAINNIAANDNIIVAIRADGRSLYSATGDSFSFGSQISSSALNSIIYDGEKFITAGNNGFIAYSYNGVNWTSVSNDIVDAFRNISYNEQSSMYYFVGDTGIIYMTHDFQNWESNKVSDGALYAIYSSGNTLIYGGEYVLGVNTTYNGFAVYDTGNVINISSNGQAFPVAYDYNTEYISEIGKTRLNNDPISHYFKTGMYLSASYYDEVCGNEKPIEVRQNNSRVDGDTTTSRSPIAWYDTLFADTAVGDTISIGINGEFVTYKCTEACGARFALYYVNKFGGVDSLLCRGNYQESFQNSPYDIDTNYNRTYPDRFQNTRIQSTATRRFSLNTGFLTDEESAKIDHLFLSTRIWLHDLEDGLIYAALIRDTSFQVKKHRDNRSYINYTVNVEQSQDVIRR